MPSWTSYLFSGVMALILSWAVTGCRLGNHVENQPQEPSHIKFYATTSQTFALSASYIPQATPEDGLQVKQDTAPLDEIPSFIQQIMSDPVAFFFDPQNQNEGAVLSYKWQKGDPGIPVTYDANMNFGAPAQSRAYDWTVDGYHCTRTLSEEVKDGLIVAAPAPYQVTVDANQKLTVSGKLELTYTRVDSFDGNCAPLLQYAADCLSRRIACKPDTLALFEDIFDPFVNRVLTIDDIATVSSVSYSVSYK